MKKNGFKQSIRFWKWKILLFVMICIIPIRIDGQAILGGDWRADVSSFCQKLIKEDLIPGMGVAVAQNDWVVYSQGFGKADSEAGLPVTETTRFYIASTTKSLTALAVALAAHNGDIDLDKTMTHYLPEAKLPIGTSPKDITIRDLLTLTHGLSGNGPVVFRTAYSGDFTRSQLLELLTFHETTGEKGTFDYNNLGYNLLGMILESRFGASWKDVVQDKVLAPLKMINTTAYRSRIESNEIAYPHQYTQNGWHRVYLAKFDENCHAAGGHFASARDLARYVAAHLSGGIVEGKRIFPKEPVMETHRKHVDQNRDFGPFHRFGWGFGWDLGTYGKETIIHRFGSFTGYRSHVSFMPDRGLGVIVLVNGSGPASSRAADMAATYIYDRLLNKKEFESSYDNQLEVIKRQISEFRNKYSEHLSERKARLKPMPHPLEAYAGIFENAKLGRMQWRVLANGLEVKMGVMYSRAEVYNSEKNQLRVEMRGRGETVEFEFHEASDKAQILRYQGEEFHRIQRKTN
jgi:CubicO group peptidase (beta-lactamase class C family)